MFSNLDFRKLQQKKNCLHFILSFVMTQISPRYLFILKTQTAQPYTLFIKDLFIYIYM